MKTINSNEIVIKEAKAEDAELIFSLSNDSEVRKNSINQEEIKWQDHLKWFNNKLTDEDYKIFLCYYESYFVGQVKFDINGDEAVISISIVKNFRGSGLSKRLLSKSTAELNGLYPKIKKIVAFIKPANEPSIKSFLRAGFFYSQSTIINKETYSKYILDIGGNENIKL